MNENFKWIAAAVGVVGLSIGAILYFSQRERAAPDEVPVVAAPPPAALPAEEPAIKHPLPELAQPEPLPPLDQTDTPLLGAIEGLIGQDSVERFVVQTDLIRHMVVTIDNLTTEQVAARVLPVKPTQGRFAVGGTEDAPVLDPANFDRYKPLVELIRTSDTKTLVSTYTRYYPRFQEVYESLGHPPEYFNDRVIEVIDHLLATPDLQGPVALARPSVQYEYADPELEARSAGQKLLIRMGSDNARAVKDKLRELRSALAAQQPGK